MSTTVTPKPGSQLWGIYHTDREHARELGDPLRTTIEAPSKIAAEEAAAKLGFGDPVYLHVTHQTTQDALAPHG